MYMYIFGLLICFIQEGWTSLMSAAFNGHVDVVRVLMGAGVDIHAQDKVHVL